MTYEDKRGWQYRVMAGIQEPPEYRARYHKPDRKPGVGWKSLTVLPWRKTEEEAERDLAEYAGKHGMKEAKEKAAT